MDSDLNKYSERRAHTRYPCFIRLDESRVIRDLSLGGAFVEGPSGGAEGELSLELALPDLPKTIGAKGKIVFVGGGKYGTPEGYGVQFLELDLQSKAFLHLYLQQLENEAPEIADLRNRFMEETDAFLRRTPGDFALIRTEFKRTVCDFRAYLQQLKFHLTRIETLGADLNPEARESLLTGLMDLYEEDFQKRTHRFILDLSKVIEGFNPQQHETHRRYFQTILGDLTHDSTFFKRATEKPLGYAGDYFMMELLYKGLRDGPSVWHKTVNSCLTSIPLGQAVRNRAWYLKDLIEKTTLSRDAPRIMSLACGPCEEVRLFVKHSPKGYTEFFLVDQDTGALSYAEGQLEAFKRDSDKIFHFRNDSTRNFLKNPDHFRSYPPMDLIYTAGLYDYLKPETASALTHALYKMLEPGGTLVIGNFVKGHSFSYFIEYASDWFLIHRSEEDMLALAPSEVLKEHKWVEREPSGVNLFLCIRKPTHH